MSLNNEYLDPLAHLNEESSNNLNIDGKIFLFCNHYLITYFISL